MQKTIKSELKMQERVIFSAHSIAVSPIAGMSQFCMISAFVTKNQRNLSCVSPARQGPFSAEFYFDHRKTFWTAPAINP
jgi:hypothetical protein